MFYAFLEKNGGGMITFRLLTPHFVKKKLSIYWITLKKIKT